MSEQRIEVSKQFSRFPAGRYYSDGPFSGQRFREEILVPALRAEADGKIYVILDGLMGYGSSFLEEAFGGLVRVHGFTAKELEKRIEIVCESDKSIIADVREHILKARFAGPS